jgi:hypothetical protein
MLETTESEEIVTRKPVVSNRDVIRLILLKP